jgi:hypothetical protein
VRVPVLFRPYSRTGFKPAFTTVFYDARLIHFSPPNQSDHTRLAVNVSFVPKEAPLVHSFRSGESTIDLLAIDPSFFTHHVIGEVPKGEKFDEVPFRFEILYPEFEGSNGISREP